MAILFPKLYIRTDLDSDVIILDDVTAIKRSYWRAHKGTYRNGGVPAPGTLDYFAAAPSAPTKIGTGVPVIGRPGVAPTSSISLTNLMYVASDEQAGIPPRDKKENVCGYIIALKDAVIPEPEAVTNVADNFTVNVTSDVCAGSFAANFKTGDIVAVSTTGTLPGVNTSLLYKFQAWGTVPFGFRLLNVGTNTLVDFTGSPSGTHSIVRVEAAALPANKPDTGALHYFPDAWNPRWSTTDPRLS